MPSKTRARNKVRETPSTLSLSEQTQSLAPFCDDHTGSILLAVAEQNLERLAECLSDGHGLHDAQLNGCSALLLAVKLGNLDMVKIMLHHKASVDNSDSNGATVLHHAAIHGFADITHCLVTEGGAALDRANKAGCTPLYQAAQHGHVDCARTLITLAAQLETRTRTGATPIYIASDRGSLVLTDILLNAGADVNVVTQFQMTPLLIASFNGHHEVVNSLLSRNVDTEQRGPCGGTALYVSAQEGHQTAAEVLIRHGAKVDSRCDEGSDLTPSLIAAMQGHDHLVRVLLEARGDIGLTAGKGNTLAIMAARHGRTHVLKTLVEFGGSKVLNEPNADGLSALDFSKRGRHAETTSYIKTVLAMQKEDELKAWEANLEDLLEDLDPTTTKQTKAKPKRKRKVNASCTETGDACCVAADMPGSCYALEAAVASEAAKPFACDEDLIRHGGEIEVDVDTAGNKGQEISGVPCMQVKRNVTVESKVSVSLPESPAHASQDDAVPWPSPASNVSAAGPLRPLSAPSAAPCASGSPLGFHTVLPTWPSTPEWWPSLPPAWDVDMSDMVLPEKSVYGKCFQDTSPAPLYANLVQGKTEYVHSALLASWLPSDFVPAVCYVGLELN
eukprot:TRINITY_DN72143_c0_g1_i1.p1 TRINITY_DN72143_c0_g1~~TRINITY_DN72143_c0_g1_i1.p1  ORF type:complete len:617 (-),score=76.90 TRINITY_DN72143_c0_g1_i1:233-2083(-)